MRQEHHPELKNRTFFYKGMRVGAKVDISVTGYITCLHTPDPKHEFWAAEDSEVQIAADSGISLRLPTYCLLPDPIPACPLNDPKLRHGPYTIEQWHNGQISCYDCGEVYGYLYQPERFTEPDKEITGTSYYLPGYCARMPMFWNRQEAVEYLQQSYYGQVQRYAADIKLLLGQCKESVIGRDECMYIPPYPWLTAGITDIVNVPKPKAGEEAKAFMSILSACSDNPPKVHMRS